MQLHLGLYMKILRKEGEKSVLFVFNSQELRRDGRDRVRNSVPYTLGAWAEEC